MGLKTVSRCVCVCLMTLILVLMLQGLLTLGAHAQRRFPLLWRLIVSSRLLSFGFNVFHGYQHIEADDDT